MTLEEIEILLDQSVRQAVDAHLGCDPLRVALDKSVPHAGLVASQVKYLSRAKTKLPSYYAARCIIPPLAFEQSSSEQTASNKRYGGKLCIDLTCGLGVDSFCFSRRFDRVIAVERDLVLAELAKINFDLLGVNNVEVVNMSAEQFLAQNAGINADLVYADPDRRSVYGRKLVTLGDCSPDISALLPTLRMAACKVVVKLSPLFDTDEAFRTFGPHVMVEVVSLRGECKELLVEIDDSLDTPLIKASLVGVGAVEYPYGCDVVVSDGEMGVERWQYLTVPDVALSKAKIAIKYFRDMGFCIASDNSFAFSQTMPTGDVFGRRYMIKAIYPYSPKKLKKELKSMGVNSLNILRKEFPYSAHDISRQLSIREGGERFAAFTRIDGRLWMLMIEPLQDHNNVVE